MTLIALKWFGGMAPRMGEQHLPPPHATDAQNTNLYSGELRPLIKPTLAHEFPRPGDNDFYAPALPPEVEPSPIPGDPDMPSPPEGCIAATITTDLPNTIDSFVGDQQTLQVTVNSDATAPVFYQWYEDGIFMPGEVNSSLSLAITADTNGKRYTVLVSNPCGLDQSATTTILLDNTP